MAALAVKWWDSRSVILVFDHSWWSDLKSSLRTAGSSRGTCNEAELMWTIMSWDVLTDNAEVANKYYSVELGDLVNWLVYIFMIYMENI